MSHNVKSFVSRLRSGTPDDRAFPPLPSSQTTALLQLVDEAGADLFSDASGEALVSFTVGGHRETWPVRSSATERWLVELFFGRDGRTPNSDALETAVDRLVGRARFEGRVESVGLRVAEFNGHLYLDLCNSEWRAVEIAPNGWRVIDDPPIRFRRTTGMLPMPAPKPGGLIDCLRRFINVGALSGGNEDFRFVLAVGWLLAALRPRGPFPVLAIAGEQGTAKSSFARILRRLGSELRGIAIAAARQPRPLHRRPK